MGDESLHGEVMASSAKQSGRTSLQARTYCCIRLHGKVKIQARLVTSPGQFHRDHQHRYIAPATNAMHLQ